MGDQLQVFTVARNIEFTAIDPIPLADPGQLLLPLSTERIRDDPVPEEVGVDATGNLGGEPTPGFWFTECPAGQERDAFHCCKNKGRSCTDKRETTN